MNDFLASFKDRQAQDSNDESALDRRLIELSALFEISQTLNSSLNLKSILDNILLVPMGRLMLGKGVILLQKHEATYSIETLKGLPHNLHDKELFVNDPPDHAVLISELDSEAEWINIFREFKIELIIPFIARTRILGFMGFSRKITGAKFNEKEIEFLESLSNIATTSIENALVFEQINSVNRELDNKIQELNTLFDIGKELNLTLDHDRILKLLSYALMGQVTVNNFIVVVKDNAEFHSALVKGSQFKVKEKQHCSDLCERSSFVTSPYLNDDKSEYDEFLSELGIKVVVPMLLQNETAGYIFLGPKMTGQAYRSSDLEFLQTLGNIAIISLENSRLFKETLEKQKMEEEMALAKTIQQGLLPKEMPDVAGFDIHGFNIPSLQVGGDYFDIIQIDEDTMGLVVADVSGKGMPASLLMSNCQASMHSLIDARLDPEILVGKVNNVIYRNTSPEKYITFFYGELQLSTGRFIFVNAGHNPPYVLRGDESIEELTNGGIILGMMPNIIYERGETTLLPGDILMMFTDGVTETMNEDEVEYEEKRVIDFMHKYCRKNSSKSINEILLQHLREFADGAPQSDDITVLTVKMENVK